MRTKEQIETDIRREIRLLWIETAAVGAITVAVALYFVIPCLL